MWKDDIMATGIISSIMVIFFSVAHLIENGFWLEEEYVLGDLVEINRFNYMPIILIVISVVVITLVSIIWRKHIKKTK